MLLTFASLELVLAPGVPNSAASLSYPYTNELVNSFLKAYIYVKVGEENKRSFFVSREPGSLSAKCDFRKRLHTHTHLSRSDFLFQHMLWGCVSEARFFPGTVLECIPGSEFHKFDLVEFKSVSLLRF